MPKRNTPPPPVCSNRRARHDYDIVETVEAGIELRGWEVKALREGRGNLADSYVRMNGGEARLVGLEITPYSHDATERDTSQTRRARRLLLHKHQIKKLDMAVAKDGLTAIALKIYFSGPWAKAEVALARGKRKADKRQAMKARDAKREMDRAERRGGRRRR